MCSIYLIKECAYIYYVLLYSTYSRLLMYKTHGQYGMLCDQESRHVTLGILTRRKKMRFPCMAYVAPSYLWNVHLLILFASLESFGVIWLKPYFLFPITLLSTSYTVVMIAIRFCFNQCIHN